MFAPLRSCIGTSSKRRLVSLALPVERYVYSCGYVKGVPIVGWWRIRTLPALSYEGPRTIGIPADAESPGDFAMSPQDSTSRLSSAGTAAALAPRRKIAVTMKRIVAVYCNGSNSVTRYQCWKWIKSGEGSSFILNPAEPNGLLRE